MVCVLPHALILGFASATSDDFMLLATSSLNLISADHGPDLLVTSLEQKLIERSVVVLDGESVFPCRIIAVRAIL
jgi:hypothetical protein